jgi:hypothetical protein
MASAARTAAVCLKAAEAALMAFAFRERPVFRMGYDAHVRAWDKAKRADLWTAYESRPDFARAYDTRMEAERRHPLRWGAA